MWLGVWLCYDACSNRPSLNLLSVKLPPPQVPRSPTLNQRMGVATLEVGVALIARKSLVPAPSSVSRWGVASGVRGVVTNCVYLQSGRRDESKSSSRSETERGRRSMEVRKSSTSERDRDRRKSAPGPVPRRYVAYAVFLLRIRQYFAYSLKFKLFNTSFSGLVVAAVSVVYVSGLPLAPLHLEGAPLLT